MEELETAISRAGRQSYKSPGDTRKTLLSLKRKMLEASVFALQEGDGLIQCLNEAWLQTQPQITSSETRLGLGRSIETVEIWMETIYDRRTRVTRMLQDVLEAYKAQNQIEAMDSSFEDKLNRLRQKELNLGQNLFEAGEYSKTARFQLDEIIVLRPEIMELEQCPHYLKYEEFARKRVTILEKACDYFQLAEETLKKLSEVESVIKDVSVPVQDPGPTLENLSACQAVTEKLVSEANEVAKDVITVAVDLTACETSGITKKLAFLTDKAKIIQDLCREKQKASQRKSATLKNFHGELKEVGDWLKSRVPPHSKDLVGSNVPEVTAFLNRNKDTLQAVQRKSQEVEGMLGALKIMQEDPEEWSLDTVHRQIVNHISSIAQCLEQRLEIGQALIKFFQMVDEIHQLSQELLARNDIEETDGENHHRPSWETQRQNIQQLYLQICNTSKNCLALLNERSNAQINVEAAQNDVRSRMDSINGQQNELISHWNERKNERAQLKKQVDEQSAQIRQILAELRSAWTFFNPFLNLSSEPSLMVSTLENSYVQIANVRSTLQRLEKLIRFGSKPGDFSHEEAANEVLNGQVIQKIL